MSRERMTDVNGILFLWTKVKELISSRIEGKADRTELHSHANKGELDKIQSGDVEQWRDMATTGVPEFPNQTTLDGLGTSGGKLTFNGSYVDTDTTYDLSGYATTLQLADYAKTSALDSYVKTTTLSNYAKVVDLDAYAKTTDLASYATVTALGDKADKTELSNYAKAASVYDKSEVYTKQEVDNKTSSAMRYKGTVLNYAALPTGAVIGDTYNITNESENNKAGDNAVWAGDHWDILSGVIDMTNVLTTEDIATIEELEAILV